MVSDRKSSEALIAQALKEAPVEMKAHSVFDNIKIKFAEWAEEKDSKALGKEMYSYTKQFLETNTNKLSPKEKGEVLKSYITTWKKNHCTLDIADTEYADLYKERQFGKYRDTYNKHLPMLAGFNLHAASLGEINAHDSVFLSINFSGADFTNASLEYSHFENCDLTGIKANKSDDSFTNLSQAYFIKCDLTHANFTNILISSAYFEECINENLNDEDKSDATIINPVSKNKEDMDKNSSTPRFGV